MHIISDSFSKSKRLLSACTPSQKMDAKFRQCYDFSFFPLFLLHLP